MLDRKRNRQLQAARKHFATCGECGLAYDLETDHECPESIHSDRVQRMRGTCSVLCPLCETWHAAGINRQRTVSWYCENTSKTYHRSLKAVGETDIGPSPFRPPPLPPATPGSARYGAG